MDGKIVLTAVARSSPTLLSLMLHPYIFRRYSQSEIEKLRSFYFIACNCYTSFIWHSIFSFISMKNRNVNNFISSYSGSGLLLSHTIGIVTQKAVKKKSGQIFRWQQQTQFVQQSHLHSSHFLFKLSLKF